MKPLHWDAINPFTGQPFTFDDPNLFWGDPSYYLEPDDPGFVPYPSATPLPTAKPRKRTMAKSDYISNSDEEFAAQLDTFKTSIGAYAPTLGLLPADVTSQANDAAYFAYVLAGMDVMRGGAQQWTSWKNLTRGGGSMPPAGAPLAPVLPAAVPAVAPGVEVRFRALVKQIKAHKNYNEAIGHALGIEGAATTAPDLSAIQPTITAKVQGGSVFIGWGWNGNSAFLDMLEIQVDRADGKGWVFLTYDSTPNYTDTTPLPAAPTKWKYRAIYRVDDHQVGQWSDTVEIAVGG